MTIDEPLLGAVSHYLMGRVSAAGSAHSELEEHPECDLSALIEEAKAAFLRDGKAILADPAHYAHQEGYSVRAEDRAFLNGLLEEAECADWNSREQVERLAAKIDEYAPYGGIGG